MDRKISDEKLNLLWQMEIVCYKCIHTVIYCEGLIGKGESEFWKLTQNCYGEAASLAWCQVFKDKNEPVYYKHLFEVNGIEGFSAKYQYSNVSASILASIGLTEPEYKDFKAQVVKFRNKYVAHREFEIGSVKFPKVDHLKKTCFHLRSLFIDLIKDGLMEDPENNKLLGLLDHFNAFTNERIERRCKKHLEQLVYF